MRAQELVDLHHYTYEVDLHAMLGKSSGQADRALTERVHAVNALLASRSYFSTQKLADYDKMMSQSQMQGSTGRKMLEFFFDKFMSVEYFTEYAGLGLSPFVPAEKEINSLTQTVFYQAEMMSRQAWRQSYEFEKECIKIGRAHV